MSGPVTVAIFVAFLVLLIVGATSTVMRSIRYRQRGLPQPVLLGRDRDLLLGLAVPFLAIGFVRLLGLRDVVTDEAGRAALWWVLATGLPPVYAVARYCWFELFVIERTAPAGDQ